MTNVRKTWKIAGMCLLFLLLGLVFSCEETGVKEELSPSKGLSVQEQNLAMHQLGIALAKALENPDFKEFLFWKANQQFDGDFDILLAEVKNQKIPLKDAQGRVSGETTFEEMLLESASSNERTSLDYALSQITTAMPLLNISIPNMSEIATTEELNAYLNEYPNTPVAVLDSSYDDATSSFVTAYDSQGKAIKISCDVEPTYPVVVIGKNERIIEVSKNDSISSPCPHPYSLTPYFEDNHYFYFLKSDYYEFINPLCGGGGGGGTPPLSTCDRDAKNTKDELHTVKFRSMDELRNVEKWTHGQPEVRVIIVFAQYPQANAGFQKFSKYLGSDDWYKCCNWRCIQNRCTKTRTFDSEIISWNKVEIGNLMQYNFIEEDNEGNDLDINVSFTVKFDESTSGTVSGKYTIKSKDTDIGTSFVEYCDEADGEGYMYRPGIIDFTVRQRLQ
ncbi:MAG: hypothetical protein OHK0038_27950 [Flammeovirgaceae bacterium]